MGKPRGEIEYYAREALDRPPSADHRTNLKIGS